MTPFQAADALERFLKKEPNLVANAIRRVVRSARTDGMNRMRSRGIGLALFRRRAFDLRQIVKTIRIRQEGNAIIGGVEVKGIAALIEMGGRTLPHPIKPKLGTMLALKLPQGRVFARAVNHPGSRIPAQPSLRPALNAAMPRLATEIDEALAAAARKELG